MTATILANKNHTHQMEQNKDTVNKYFGVTIDESLNKYDGIILFPEKLKRANESLKKSGLPKEITEKQKPEPHPGEMEKDRG